MRHHTFPVHLRTGWLDFSPALHWHAIRRLESALRSNPMRIRFVTMRIMGHEPENPASRRCTIDLVMEPLRFVSASSTGVDPYELVDRATECLVAKMHEPVAAKPLSRIA